MMDTYFLFKYQSIVCSLFRSNYSLKIIIQKLHHLAVTVSFNRKLNFINFACMLLKEVSVISRGHLMYTFLVIKNECLCPIHFTKKIVIDSNYVSQGYIFAWRKLHIFWKTLNNSFT